MAKQPESSSLMNSMLGEYYMRILIGPYERPEPFEESKFKPKYAVFLPLPQELRDDTSVEYNNIPLNSVGDLINGDIASGAGAAALRNSGTIVSGAASSIVGAGAGALAGLASRSSKFGDFGQNAAESTVENLFPPDQVASAFQQSLGVAPNPNPSVAFNGPVLREFSYTWTLLPRSKAESVNITNLVKKLKASALPENTFSGAGALLNFPYMCQLNFFPWDKGGSGNWNWNNKKSIIRIKKCVMASVNVNYTPSNVPAFFHGTQAPIATQITINFKELEYMLSSDWGGGDGYGLEELAEDAGELANTVVTGLLRNPVTAPIGIVASGAQSLIKAVL